MEEIQTQFGEALRVASLLADLANEKWPFGSEEFIGSSPAAERICKMAGVTDNMVIKMVEMLLYHTYSEVKK